MSHNNFTNIFPSAAHTQPNNPNAHPAYDPTNPNIKDTHLAEFNAVRGTSLLLAKLGDHDVAPFRQDQGDDGLFAVNPKLVYALEYTCESLIREFTTAGGAATHTYQLRDIDQQAYDELNIPRPELIAVVLNSGFTPLHALATRAQHEQMFQEIQKKARDMVRIMIEARRRTMVRGSSSWWNWKNSEVINFSDTIMSLPARDLETTTVDGDAIAVDTYSKQRQIEYQAPLLLTHPDHPSPFSNATSVLPAERTIDSSHRSAPLAIEFPSRLMIEHPDYPLRLDHRADCDKSVRGDGAMVVHPTASLYANTYGRFDPWDGTPMIDDGYVAGGCDYSDFAVDTGMNVGDGRVAFVFGREVEGEEDELMEIGYTSEDYEMEECECELMDCED